MSNSEIRNKLKVSEFNPVGDITSEIKEGVEMAIEAKDTRESLTISYGCGALWSIWCC